MGKLDHSAIGWIETGVAVERPGDCCLVSVARNVVQRNRMPRNTKGPVVAVGLIGGCFWFAVAESFKDEGENTGSGLNGTVVSLPVLLIAQRL